MKLEGSYLVGAEYEPLFNPHEFGVERRRFETGYEYEVGVHWGLRLQEPDYKLTYRVIDTDFVSMEDGTGIADVTVFNDVQQKSGDALFKESWLVVEGKVQKRGPKSLSVIAEKVSALKNKDDSFPCL